MIRLVKKCLRRARIVSLWLISSLFPINRKKIVVSSYGGRGYGDNPKYIADAIIKQNGDVKIVWLVSDEKDALSLPPEITAAKTYSAKGIFHFCTARVWIDNRRKSLILFKRKKQVYIQTWHGFALKKIEKDAEAVLDKGYVKSAKKDSQCIDFIISENSFMTGIYKNSFWYDGEVIEWGSPRNDIVINGSSDAKQKVYDLLKIPEDTLTVLYAPTFRSDMSIEAYSLDYDRIISAFEKRFNKKCVILVRFHPNIINKSDALTFNDRIINATYYPDMQELLCTCDIVISDYSSLMFDFALSYKPCFQFATDIDKYKDDRNFYFDIRKLPFYLAESNDELEKMISDFDYNEYKSQLSDFFEKAGMVTDGDSSQKCAKLILKLCENKRAPVGSYVEYVKEKK